MYLLKVSSYIANLDGFVNRVVLYSGNHWQIVELQSVNAVRARVLVGYGDGEDKVPETMKLAMILCKGI